MFSILLKSSLKQKKKKTNNNNKNNNSNNRNDNDDDNDNNTGIPSNAGQISLHSRDQNTSLPVS